MLTKIQIKDGKEIDLLKLKSNINNLLQCLDKLNLKSEDLEDCISVINWLLGRHVCKCEAKDAGKSLVDGLTDGVKNNKDAKEIIESFNYIKRVLENYGRNLNPEYKLSYYAKIGIGLKLIDSTIDEVEKTDDETASLSEVAENIHNALENIFGSLFDA